MGNASANLAPAFTADTAARTGRSERDVQRDAQRGENISEEVLTKIAGTDLDKGAILDELARTPKAEQDAKLQEIAARTRTGPI